MGALRVLDKEAGDLKINWDPDNPDEVSAAREQFDKLVGKKITISDRKYKYAAYSVKKDGEKNKKIAAFDPEAALIIIAPDVEAG